MSLQSDIFTYDKRASLRVLSNVKSTVYITKDHLSKAKGIPAAVYDISETGSLLKLKKYLPDVKDVYVNFIFSFPFKDVVIKSKVIWSHKEKNLHGINFLNLNQDQALFLDEYINRHTGTRKIKLDRRRIDRRSDPVSYAGTNVRAKERRSLIKHVKPKYFSNTLDDYIKDLTDFEEIEELEATTSAPKLPIKQFDLLIGGKHVNTGKYEYFPYMEKVITDFVSVRNTIQDLKKGIIPKNPEKYIFARYSIGSADSNVKAVQSASEAFKTFSKMPLAKRKKILEDIHTLLLKNKKTLIDLMVIEGHPRQLAEWEFDGMEANYRSENLDFYKNEMLREVGRTQKEKIYLARKPEGVICVSPPKNASCSIALIAGFSLLAGNTIVIKPPLRCPLSAIYLWDKIINTAIKANDGPDGVVNIVLGNSKKIFEEWLESDAVRCILHFGNSKTGIEIGERIYQAGKKPILELSGNDFMIIWKDADIEKTSDALLDAFLGSTQICMVPKKAIIHTDIYDKFISVFLEKIKTIKAGLPSDVSVLLSPVGKIKEYTFALSDAINHGARLLTGGYRLNHSNKKDDNGFFISPTVIEVGYRNAFNLVCVKEENFFPLIPVIPVTADKDADPDESIFNKIIQLVNSNAYGLRTSIWVSSQEYMSRFADEINTSGIIRINSRHTGFSLYLSSIGGPGLTGGPFGEMNYMWQKTSRLQGISINQPPSDK